MAKGRFSWAILSSCMEPVNVDSERKAPVVTLNRPKTPCGRKELGDVIQFRTIFFLLFGAILYFPFVLDLYIAIVLLDKPNPWSWEARVVDLAVNTTVLIGT